MIRIKTNIGKVVELNIEKLKSLADNDKMLRTAAITVLGLMKKRIHEDGLDAGNKPIGTYSPGYMKLRTGNYFNSAKVSRGKNKGNLKDAGVFSRGASKGQPRTKYNRTGETKVVLSLTRQMENDMKVIALRNNSYGIGYTNKLNYDKSQWCEATYNRKGKIFALSSNEQQVVVDIANQFTQDALSGQNS